MMKFRVLAGTLIGNRLARGRPLKVVRLALWSLLALSVLSLPSLRAEGPRVDVLRLQGVINPISSDYLKRGIDLAEAEAAAVLVIQLDTPGGLDISMREIIQRILSSRVPVIVYVSPPGARAASAGAFITMSSHVAAMAPNTAIGAAHPVAGGGAQLEGPMLEKVTNDAVAYIKSLASQRNRNVEWAEKAVRESISSTEQEALDLKVVDFVAPDLITLLNEVDGRTVKLIGGEQTLSVRNATLRYIDMNSIERFLFAITDPNIAYILLSIAMTGIFLELSNPGAILPGIVGGICLLLALYALGTLPVNYAGLLLIALAFLFFLAEILVVSHGMLTIGGIASLIIGSLLLFNSSAPYFTVSWGVIAAVVATVSSLVILVITAVIRVHRQPYTLGGIGLVGKVAQARTELAPEGLVFLDGEHWRAVSDDEAIASGEEVTIKAVEGLKLRVTKRKKEG